MWQHLFDGFKLIHGIGLAIAAIASFKFLARTRFWFPKYIHVLGAIGFLVSLWVASAMPPDAPANKWGLTGKVLIAFALPVMIYGFFIVYGGPRAAFDSRFTDAAPCPFCQSPVRVLPEEPGEPNVSPHFAEHACPECGREHT